MTLPSSADSPQNPARTRQSRQLFWRVSSVRSIPEMVAGLVVLVSAILLEILPILAWMIVFSAANQSLDRLPLPLWWLGVVVLAGWSLSVMFRRFGEARVGQRRAELFIRLFTVVGWILAVALSLLLSPGAYAGLPLQQVIASLLMDLSSGASRLGVDGALAILVAYLWWRGLLLGRLPLARDRLYTRAVWGGIAIIASLILLNNLPQSAHAEATTLLALLLPAYIFIGLTGVALAHLLDTLHEHQRRQRRAVTETGGAADAASGQSQASLSRAWIMSALGLSAAIVGGALILGLLLSYHSIQSLAQLLHPVADAFGAVLSWLVDALAFLLFLLLNPLITWIHNLVLQHEKGGQSSAPAPTRHLPNTSIHNVPPDWLLVGRIALVVLLVLVVTLVFWWVLRRFAAGHRGEAFEEEREALSASEVLGAQLRGLLAGLRRPRAAPHAGDDPLVPESVRYLYRAVLEGASAASLGHEPAETPDEYEQRLQVLLRADVTAAEPESAQAASGTRRRSGVGVEEIREGLEALTAAYDQARYGSHSEGSGEPDGPAPARLQAAMGSIVGWLNARGQPVRAGSTGSRRVLGRRN